tara:strand:+ start:296 stop:1018 length:723 start_codon:yes stop_codon:yes gene_type:complete
MDFVKRARARAVRKEATANAVGALGASKYVHNRAFEQRKVHPYFRTDAGAEFARPFDNKGLPSINAMVCAGTFDGIMPVAMFNVGYKRDSTFPATLDPTHFNQVNVTGDTITIDLPSNYEAYSSAVMSHGLELAYAQHGKIYAAKNIQLEVTRHFVGNSTSAAFPMRSKYGRIAMGSIDREGQGTTIEKINVPAGRVVELGPITQALVSVPDVGEVDRITGRVKKPQYLLTDKVIIRIKG